MLQAVEMYLLNLLLAEASSPAAKQLAIAELKKLDSAVKSPILKAMIEAAEAFLATPAAAA